jgi:hypothetical protein
MIIHHLINSPKDMLELHCYDRMEENKEDI